MRSGEPPGLSPAEARASPRPVCTGRSCQSARRRYTGRYHSNNLQGGAPRHTGRPRARNFHAVHRPVKRRPLPGGTPGRDCRQLPGGPRRPWEQTAPRRCRPWRATEEEVRIQVSPNIRPKCCQIPGLGLDWPKLGQSSPKSWNLGILIGNLSSPNYSNLINVANLFLLNKSIAVNNLSPNSGHELRCK